MGALKHFVRKLETARRLLGLEQSDGMLRITLARGKDWIPIGFMAMILSRILSRDYVI